MAKNSRKSLLTKNKLRTLFESRLGYLYKKLKKIENGFDIEDIHLFRVEMKKLKALLSLLRTVQRSPSGLKISKNLQKIYKILGHIRALQLQVVFVGRESRKTGIPDPEIYIGNLKKETDLVKIKAIELVKQKNPLDKEIHLIGKNLPDHLLLSTLESYFDKKIYAVKTIMAQVLPDEKSMHRIRKHLKDVQYNCAFSKIPGVDTPDWGFIPLKKIQTITGQLGNYHDLRISLDLLHEELKESNIPATEKNGLQQIQNKWQKEIEYTGNQVFQACRELLLRDPVSLRIKGKNLN